LKIHFNIILQSLPRSAKCCLINLNLITQIIFGEEYRAQSTLLRGFFLLPHYLIPPRLNISISTLFSNTLSLQICTHTKQQAKLLFCISYRFMIG
jgi:hypothetical protein